MLSDKQIRQFMDQAIEESKKSKPEKRGKITPKVGAIIVDADGNIVATAYRNEDHTGGHAEFIAIDKARHNGCKDFSKMTIFATLEPCTHRGQGKIPCAERIVKAGFECVYIGALDPNPAIAVHGELYLRSRVKQVERFPGVLDTKIRNMNKEFWDAFASAHLPTNSMYVSTRITDIIKAALKKNKVDASRVALDGGISLYELEKILISSRIAISKSPRLRSVLNEARADAFDQKYSHYTYEQDARSVGNQWEREIPGILKRFHIRDYHRRPIINVGFGNGEEGISLFKECDLFTGVDIGPESVRIASSRFPRYNIFQMSAENLSEIQTASQNIYISLRTYQSAFFDVDRAVQEAYRVLMPGGIIIISIANAYLDGKRLVRGLLPHGSSIVNRNEAHGLISNIRRKIIKFQFEDVGVHSGFAEEYVFGYKPTS